MGAPDPKCLRSSSPFHRPVRSTRGQNRLSVLRRDEIEHVEPQCIVEGVKSHQLKTRRINILNLTAERGDADEIGRPLH